MKIDRVVETSEGAVHFEGELTQEESNLVIEIGLSVLLAQGAIPYTLRHSETDDETENEVEETAEGNTIQ